MIIILEKMLHLKDEDGLNPLLLENVKPLDVDELYCSTENIRMSNYFIIVASDENLFRVMKDRHELCDKEFAGETILPLPILGQFVGRAKEMEIQGYTWLEEDMNEYMVSVKIGLGPNVDTDDIIHTEQLIRANNKDEAEAKTKKKMEDKGFHVFGFSYCDLC